MANDRKAMKSQEICQNSLVLLLHSTVLTREFAAGQNTGHRSLFYQCWNSPNPFLKLALGLNTRVRQHFRSKYYTKAITLVLVKVYGCSSIGKTMTRDLCFTTRREFVHLTLQDVMIGIIYANYPLLNDLIL